MSFETLDWNSRNLVLAHVPCDQVSKVCVLDREHREVCAMPELWQEQYNARHVAATEGARHAVPSVWPSDTVDSRYARVIFDDECRFVTGRAHKTLRGHTAVVNMTVFSPDGHTVATASEDCTAKLWNARTGQLKATLEGHTFDIHYLAFSPDGRTIATASDDNTVMLWDTQSGALRITLEGHEEMIESQIICVAFSPDGASVATAGGDGTAILWTSAGELTWILDDHMARVFMVAFSPDGQTLATCADDETAKLWDVLTGELRWTLENTGWDITGWQQNLAFSPDSTTVVVGSTAPHVVQVWDVRTGERLRTLQAITDCVAFSPDGRLIATGANEHPFVVQLWDARTGDLRETLIGHQSANKNVAFSPDGRTLSSADDSRVMLWNVEKAALIAILQKQQVCWVAFSPDSRTVAVASGDGTTELWAVPE